MRPPAEAAPLDEDLSTRHALTGEEITATMATLNACLGALLLLAPCRATTRVPTCPCALQLRQDWFN